MLDSDISLKDYMDEKFKSVFEKIDHEHAFTAQHFQLNELAIKKAEDSMTVRLDSMNEFRAQLNQERGSLCTKEQMQTVCNALDTRIDLLEKINDKLEGKASVEDVKTVTDSASTAKLIAIIGSALAIIAILVSGVISFLNK